MMSISELQQTIAITLFDGNNTIAGLAMFAVVMLLIFTLSRRVYTSMVLTLPVSFIFWMLDVITTDMMIVLIVAALLGMALYSKFTIGLDWNPLEGRDEWGRRR